MKRKATQKKTVKKPAPAKRTRRTARDGMIIRVLAKTNPKRPGTVAHKMFSLYEDGATVRAFKDRGGRSIDLHFDLAKNFIRLEESRS